jgi:hypothetical protein
MPLTLLALAAEVPRAAPQQFCRYSVIPVGAAKERKRYRKAEYGVGLSGFRMERWKGISIDENLKLMRCNNLPAVALNFRSFHFLSHPN